MQKILRFLNREINGLHQAAFLLASASVGAKILAILRDRLLASSFGAGKTLDIYYASFRFPDLLYVFSLFFVSVTALIPLFLGKKKVSIEHSRLFVNRIFTFFFVFMLFLLAIAFFVTPYLAPIIAPGFSSADSEILIKLSRILLLSPFLLGLSNLVSSVIQSFRRFFVYALSGVLYNAGIIFGLIFLYPRFGISGVAGGVVVGAALHFLIQVPSLLSLGYFPRLTLNFDFSEIKRLIKLSFPRTLGLTLNQLVLIAITAIASFLAAGSISIFNLASNLQTIPLGIVALSYSVAAFPSLATSFIKKERSEFLSSVILAFRHILFWLLPITALFIVLRAQIVRVVLGAGAFTWTDTRLTAAALALLTLSLFAQGLILLLVRAFYAASKTKLPLIINVISSFAVIFSAVGLLYCF
jgi:putative peptidoglycan lipid II flippase